MFGAAASADKFVKTDGAEQTTLEKIMSFSVEFGPSSKEILDRCAEKVEEILANHEPNKLSRKLEDDMQRFIDEVAARPLLDVREAIAVRREPRLQDERAVAASVRRRCGIDDVKARRRVLARALFRPDCERDRGVVRGEEVLA